MTSLWSLWYRFWFEMPSETKQQLGLFRAVFAGILFVMYSIRFLEFDLFFSESGLLTHKMAQSFAPPSYEPAIFFFPESDFLLFGCYITFLVLLLLLALGFLGRGLTWVVFLLHVMFFQRNLTIIYGADLVSNFLLFSLCFTNANQAWTWVPQALKRFKSHQWHWLDSMGVRMIQVQMCIIYGFTGLEKLKGSEWWDGSAVWYVLMNTQLAPIDFSFLAHVPLLIVAMTWSTLLFEVYFPVMIWFQKIRRPWLILGGLFHLGAALSMSLPFFSAIMVSTYILFWGSHRWRAKA
jgi:hypothetical protein